MNASIQTGIYVNARKSIISQKFRIFPIYSLRWRGRPVGEICQKRHLNRCLDSQSIFKGTLDGLAALRGYFDDLDYCQETPSDALPIQLNHISNLIVSRLYSIS
ncbi:hypothetical protein EYC84_000372 [Monilinia fructicola]|uniref:Uncharacterized protein n=1 Tax=Monilinia fructicola TaxID=38448 RepID=A0A5M9JRG0_MONFR|nr:hypothetical protein EYC84_000372 [Monilinia fructicola]